MPVDAGGASTFSTASAPVATNGVGGDAADEDTMKISKSEVGIIAIFRITTNHNQCALMSKYTTATLFMVQSR